MINLKIDFDEEYIKETGDFDILHQAFKDATNAVENYKRPSGFMIGKDGKSHGRWSIDWGWKKQV